MKNFINYNKSAEDSKYYERLLSDFGTVSDDLLLFFYLGNKQHNWITKYYFRPYKQQFSQGAYSLAAVQEALLDYDQVIENVLGHYFENESLQTIRKCKDSLIEANKLISGSDYEACVKSALYAFLIDPVPIIQRLSHELMAKEFLLSKQYEQKSGELVSLQEHFDLERLSDDLKHCGNKSTNIDCFENILVSFCCKSKNTVRFFTFSQKDVVLVVLGSDYIDELQYIKTIEAFPKLHEFGLALSEENRVAILEYIYERNEVTIKDVEQDLEMAGTNSYYHIAIMVKAGMLKTRNRGRTILYSVNSDYFKKIANILESFSHAKGINLDEILENTDDDDHH